MNEVRISVHVDGPQGDGFERTRAKSKTFGDGVKADLDKASKSAADFDRLVTANMRRGETAFEAAGRAADDMRGKVDRLRQELKTGDSGGGVFVNLTAAESDLKKLEGFISAMEPEVKTRARKVGKAAGDGMLEGIPLGIGKGAMALGGLFVKLVDKIMPDVVAEAGKLGEKAGKAVADGVASSADVVAQDAPMLFSPEGAAGAAILAVVGLSLAPALGAAVGAAVTAALGAGMVGAAAYLLKDEPAIRAAGHKLKEDLLGDLTSGASVLEGPMQQAISVLDSIVNRIDFRGMFAGLAPALTPLAHALGSMFDSIVKGLTNVGRTFGEIFSDPSMVQTLEGLGQDIEAFFDTISRHKDEVEVTLKVIFGLIEEILGAINMLVNVGSFFATPLTWFSDATGPAQKFSTAVGDAATALGNAAGAAEAASPSYADLAQKLNQTAVNADTLAGSMADKLFNAIMGNERAVLAWYDAEDKLTGAIKENGRTVDINSAKGRANISAILDAVQANINLYDQQIQLGMSAQDAAKAYDANTAALERHLKKLGLTKAQIDSVVGAYKTVPDKVNTTIALQGLTKAIGDLTTLIEMITGINLTPVTVRVKVKETPTGAHGPVGRTAHAAGGIASGLSWVGEQGAELVRLPQGSMVYPHGQSMAMAAQGAAGHGSMALSLQVAPSADSAVAQLVNNLVRTGQIRLSVRDTTGRTQAVTVSGG